MHRAELLRWRLTPIGKERKRSSCMPLSRILGASDVCSFKALSIAMGSLTRSWCSMTRSSVSKERRTRHRCLRMLLGTFAIFGEFISIQAAATFSPSHLISRQPAAVFLTLTGARFSAPHPCSAAMAFQA